VLKAISHPYPLPLPVPPGPLSASSGSLGPLLSEAQPHKDLMRDAGALTPAEACSLSTSLSTWKVIPRFLTIPKASHPNHNSDIRKPAPTPRGTPGTEVPQPGRVTPLWASVSLIHSVGPAEDAGSGGVRGGFLRGWGRSGETPRAVQVPEPCTGMSQRPPVPQDQQKACGSAARRPRAWEKAR
jgi:hypothetical protein